MEDPVRFDVWATIGAGHTQEVCDALRRTRPELSNLQLRVFINKSVATGVLILVAKYLNWSAVELWRSETPPWAISLQVLHEDYTSTDASPNQYCDRHHLSYGGCLGCHVCRGFYVR